MNLDILSTTYGQTTFNIKLAHVLGLKTALYWSVLVDALYQAKKKGKVSENGYFTLNREYVFEKTTLTTLEQKECDKLLIELGYLDKGQKVNSIRVDASGITKLITEDDDKRDQQIKALAERIFAESKEQKKADGMSSRLKARVKETDLDVADALYGWIDSLGAKANQKTVDIFQADLNSYTKDKKLKLELIRRATVCGYRDFRWVADIYESDMKKAKPANIMSGPTNVAKSLAEVDMKNVF